MADTELTKFREYAAVDWVIAPRGQVLHALTDSGHADDNEWVITDGLFACARSYARALIPSLGARLSTPRCERCCDVTETSRGVGSPKNDPTARGSATRVTAALVRLAARAVVETQAGSVNVIARRCDVDIDTAAELMHELEAAGVVGPAKQPLGRMRDVLLTPTQLDPDFLAALTVAGDAL